MGGGGAVCSGAETGGAVAVPRVASDLSSAARCRSMADNLAARFCKGKARNCSARCWTRTKAEMARMGATMRTMAARKPRNSMKRARALRERIRTHFKWPEQPQARSAFLPRRVLGGPGPGGDDPKERGRLDTSEGRGSLPFEAGTTVRRYRFSTGRTGKTRRKLWRK